MSAWWKRRDASGDGGRARDSRKGRDGSSDGPAFHDPLEDFELRVVGPVPPQEESLFDADRFGWAVEALKDARRVEKAEPQVDAAPEAPAEPEPPAPMEQIESSEDAAPEEDAAPQEEAAREESERRVTRVRARRSGRAHKARREPLAPSGPASPEGESAPGWFAKAGDVASRGLRTAVSVVLVAAVLLGALYGLTLGVNALARWNAKRLAAQAGALGDSTDSILVIGVSDGVAVGFTALKAERANNRVLGIAIPDGAFVEVPGQGFERIGSSYLGGPDVSKDAVSNFLGVRFRRYVVVDGDAYQSLLKDQDVAGLMARVTATDIPSKLRASLTSYFASVKPKDVWIVPLPVKPVAVGDQRYFEPQREQVADLLLQWWGVKVAQQKATPRVIVYNGVGTPGLAGLASQQLIRTGFRVVNSGNAENFDYKTTLILLYHGTQADAEAVRGILGVGEIKVQSAPQELTDLIVIIGADYRPPVDASTVPTEGAQ